MKTKLKEILREAIVAVAGEGGVPHAAAENVPLERTRDSRHGDFTSNFALTAAREARTSPRELAQKVAAKIPASELVDRVEVAGPGFINFYLRAGAQRSVVSEILARGQAYGRSNVGGGQKVLLEFVSDRKSVV